MNSLFEETCVRKGSYLARTYQVALLQTWLSVDKKHVQKFARAIFERCNCRA